MFFHVTHGKRGTPFWAGCTGLMITNKTPFCKGVWRFSHGTATTGDTVDNAKVMAKGQITIPKDVRAAILAIADVLLTGDKDFLESGLTHPAIMTPADLLLY